MSEHSLFVSLKNGTIMRLNSPTKSDPQDLHLAIAQPDGIVDFRTRISLTSAIQIRDFFVAEVERMKEDDPSLLSRELGNALEKVLSCTRYEYGYQDPGPLIEEILDLEVAVDGLTYSTPRYPQAKFFSLAELLMVDRIKVWFQLDLAMAGNLYASTAKPDVVYSLGQFATAHVNMLKFSGKL